MTPATVRILDVDTASQPTNWYVDLCDAHAVKYLLGKGRIDARFMKPTPPGTMAVTCEGCERAERGERQYNIEDCGAFTYGDGSGPMACDRQAGHDGRHHFAIIVTDGIGERVR